MRLRAGLNLFERREISRAYRDWKVGSSSLAFSDSATTYMLGSGDKLETSAQQSKYKFFRYL